MKETTEINEYNEYKEKEMDNQSLNATEIAVGSLLAGRGNYGGGGAWGGNCYDGGVYATPSSNAVRIERNGDVAAERNVGLRSLMESGFTGVRDQFNTVNRANEFNRVLAAVNQGFSTGADQRFQSELRTNDRLLALQAEINANAREAAKCCCDLKLENCENTAKILARIESINKETVERDLDRAERELIALKTQVACGCVTGCSTPCSDR